MKLAMLVVGAAYQPRISRQECRAYIKRALRPVLFLCLLATGALAFGAQPKFPPLTGRVVDQAGMLSAGTQRTLSEKLAAHERATGQQVVVAVLDDLGGVPIDQYGYQLGRHWQLGQKGKDNGVLLLVAAKAHKVRIDVGYGLEGQLTDALTFNIIDQIILPQFREGHYEQGIVAGTNAILQALGGQYKPRTAHHARHRSGGWLMLLLLGMGFLPLILRPFGYGRYRRRGFGSGLLLGGLMGGMIGRGFGGGGFGGGFGGGGFGGGGFSGGGGSFGGGGASGGW